MVSLKSCKWFDLRGKWPRELEATAKGRTRLSLLTFISLVLYGIQSEKTVEVPQDSFDGAEDGAIA